MEHTTKTHGYTNTYTEMNLDQSQMADLKINQDNQQLLLKNKQKMQGRTMRSLTMAVTKNSSNKIIPTPTNVNRARSAGEAKQTVKFKLTPQNSMSKLSKQQSGGSVVSSPKFGKKKCHLCAIFSDFFWIFLDFFRLFCFSANHFVTLCNNCLVSFVNRDTVYVCEQM